MKDNSPFISKCHMVCCPQLRKGHGQGKMLLLDLSVRVLTVHTTTSECDAVWACLHVLHEHDMHPQHQADPGDWMAPECRLLCTGCTCRSAVYKEAGTHELGSEPDRLFAKSCSLLRVARVPLPPQDFGIVPAHTAHCRCPGLYYA